MSGSDNYLSGDDYVAGITAAERQKKQDENRSSLSSFFDFHDDPVDLDPFYDEYGVDLDSEATLYGKHFDSDVFCDNNDQDLWVFNLPYPDDDSAELARLEEGAADAYFPSQGSHEHLGSGRSKSQRFARTKHGRVKCNCCNRKSYYADAQHRTRKPMRKKQRSWKFRKGRPFQSKPDLAPRKWNGSHIHKDWAYLAEPARGSAFDKEYRRYDKRASALSDLATHHEEPYTLSDWIDDCHAIGVDPSIFSSATTLTNYVDGQWREAEMEDEDLVRVENDVASWEHWDAMEWEQERLYRRYQDLIDTYNEYLHGGWSFVNGEWVAPDEYEAYDGPHSIYSRPSRYAE